MRYAVFTDVHANLEALEAVLAKIDEFAQEKPINQIWFLGDLVGYGPNPNECIAKLRERTDVIIAGNHDWAAVNKIDLDDFSTAARISAEWTAKQLTEEHREFLAKLPERLEIEECTLVHGSPYGPLWEYLTSEFLAERSFQHFTSRYCFVGHTHVPIIFQQLDDVVNTPTTPLGDTEKNQITPRLLNDTDDTDDAFDPAAEDDDETTELASIRPAPQAARATTQSERAITENECMSEAQNGIKDVASTAASDANGLASSEGSVVGRDRYGASERTDRFTWQEDDVIFPEHDEYDNGPGSASSNRAEVAAQEQSGSESEQHEDLAQAHEAPADATEMTPEKTIVDAEERMSDEIEELLALLGLSQSMVQVTNEMITPPEGDWQPPDGYRAIVNPGGVGQPRDGDPRAAFMIFDTEQGFTFYRIPYAYEKTQEKIVKVGLPQYLATRLEYGR